MKFEQFVFTSIFQTMWYKRFLLCSKGCEFHGNYNEPMKTCLCKRVVLATILVPWEVQGLKLLFREIFVLLS